MDRNIVNYQFLKSTAQCISKIATQGYIKELTSYPAQNKNRPTRQMAISSRQMETKANKKKSKEGTQRIFDLEGRN